MKKILVSMFLLVFGLCLVGCDLLEKDKNVTCKKYENCAVFTFADFSANETISFELERKNLGEGTIYYQVNLIAGVLSINYQERWHDVVQPLGEFSADDKMPINGAGGYVEGDKIMIIFESDSPIVGEIIIAFTEESLKAVQGNLQYHKHTFAYTSAGEVGHYTYYTCGCPSEEGTTPHYDENGDYLCDACKCDMTEFADEWKYDETHHWYESDAGTVYCYGEHENYDSDLNCDICGCGLENQVPTNYFLRNQLGCEWLNEINVDDITEIKIINEAVGVVPGAFKNISSAIDKTVISKIYEDCYWLDTTPITKEEGQMYGGGATTIRFILNDGTVKEIYINNGNYKDINDNYYELLNIPKFDENDEYVCSYKFVTYKGHAQIYDNYDKAICSIPMSEIEFIKVIDEIVLEGKPVTHYVETEFGKLYFISEIYFYIDGIVEGDIFNGESKPIYYQLIGKSLDDIIYQYSIAPEYK